MKEFFELLRKKNILKNGNINVPFVEKLSPVKIITLNEQLIEIAEKQKNSVGMSLFSQTASLDLGGGGEDCAYLECRLRNLDSLARFALMYSDRVYINNFLTKYVHNKNEIISIEDVNYRFCEDIYLLNYIRILLENGTIVLNSFPEVCPGCVTEMSFGLDARKRLENAKKQLEKEYLRNTKIFLKYKDGEYKFDVSGPAPYFEHGGLLIDVESLPKSLKSHPLIIEKAQSLGSVEINSDLRKKLTIHKNFVGEIISNIAFELSVAQVNKTSFLTNKKIHLDFLKSISNKSEYEEKNNISFEHLTTMVPFLNDVTISNIVKLKNREKESFVAFRKCLGDAIKEFQVSNKEFNSRDAKSIYSDIIYPRLTELDRKVKLAKKDLIAQPRRTLLALSGLITFGLYVPFLPAELKLVAAGLGLGSGGLQLLKELMSAGDAENTIKNDSLYFLWRVKNLAGKKGKSVS